MVYAYEDMPISVPTVSPAGNPAGLRKLTNETAMIAADVVTALGL